MADKREAKDSVLAIVCAEGNDKSGKRRTQTQKKPLFRCYLDCHGDGDIAKRQHRKKNSLCHPAGDFAVALSPGMQYWRQSAHDRE